MTQEEMIDIIHELIVTNTKKGLVTNSDVQHNVIVISTKDDEYFNVTVEKMSL
ncbi:MAG: hypothetical protein RR107_06330 [Clostridia bacterium]